MSAMISGIALAVTLAISMPAQAANLKAADRVGEADAFVAQAEKELGDYPVMDARVQWINENFITEDTDAVAAEYGARGTELDVKYAKGAASFDGTAGLSFDTRRKLDILKQRLVLPAPDRPGAADELNIIATRLQSTYGKGTGTLNGQPINGSDIEEAMGTNRNPDQLKEMWVSWHDNVGVPMRDDFARLVQIANAGAKELGYKDTGDMWRAGYDMPPEEFARLLDELWTQVRPLYEQLHCYTRAKLNQKYGAKVQPATGPIRADLLGNMWAQEWGKSMISSRPRGRATSATISPTCLLPRSMNRTR